jgi:hypothetical protein
MERNDTHQSPRDPGAAPPTPPYEPPAIAWDEPFAATIAASCAFADPLGGCDPRPEA